MKYQRASTGFSLPEDFAEVQLESGKSKRGDKERTPQEENERLVIEQDDFGLDHSAGLLTSRKRRCIMALSITIVFLIIVVVAAISGRVVDGSVQVAETSETENHETTLQTKSEYDDDDDDDDDVNYTGEPQEDDGNNKDGPSKDSLDDGTEVYLEPGPDDDEDETEVSVDAAETDEFGRELPPRTQPATPKTKQQKVRTAWSYNLRNPPLKPNNRPNLVFIKGVKVGGTSVALALSHAAHTYGIKLAKVPFEYNKRQNEKIVGCAWVGGGSLYFRHGYKNEWQKQCIPGVHYATVLRDPIAAALSFDAYKLNLEYFKAYPMEPCPTKQFIDVHTQMSNSELEARLQSVTACNDTPYRRNLTAIYAANQIRARDKGDAGPGVGSTYRWVGNFADYSNIKSGEDIIQVLRNEYFLVGVTERLNQFLVIIALANGWSFESIYYRKCKVSNLDVPRREFEKYFPALVAKLAITVKPADEAYRWALKQFDDHVAKLGPWFMEKVKRFEAGLKEFQARQMERIPNPYAWQRIRYADGMIDFC